MVIREDRGWSVPPTTYLSAPICAPFEIEIHCWQQQRQPCPRCGEPSNWLAHTTIVPESGIRARRRISPVCPCPDDHVRDALVRALTSALVKDILERDERAVR